jgi:L-alanine-DL-glutamate epimerase-like enolase superfamily enzyme
MQITDVELIPVFATREMGRSGPADPEKSISHHVIVQFHTDSAHIGLGEMSDVPWEISRDGLAQLRQRILQSLKGRDLLNLGPLVTDLEKEDWQHQVLCGIEIALHDLAGKNFGVPVSHILGGRFRDHIPFAYPLAPCCNAADQEANLGRIERLLDQGHNTIRYYFGADLDVDESFLTELRRRWDDQVQINALDASGRFSVEQAIEVMRRFAPFAPNFVESPIKGRHHAPIADFLTVKRETSTPISEHIADDETGVNLAASAAIDIFNTGLGYSGFHQCRRMFTLARLFNIKALMGSTVEMSIGTAARAHMAASVPYLDYPCYMAGPLVYQEQIVKERIIYKEGHIAIPNGPGLGVELDDQHLTNQRLW